MTKKGWGGLGGIFCAHPLRASSIRTAQEQSTACDQAPGAGRDAPQAPLPSPDFPSCTNWVLSHPCRVKAFPLLNPQRRKPLFDKTAQGWIFLLCHALSGPHHALESPQDHWGQRLTHVHHTPMPQTPRFPALEHTWLCLCCSAQRPQPHNQHQAQRHLGPSLKQRSKPLLGAEDAPPSRRSEEH